MSIFNCNLEVKVNKTQKEICVICEKETNIDINTPVDFRYFYVEGAGQLCEHCYKNLEK